MNISDSLKDYQQVRGLAIQSLFEIIEQSSEGTVIVDRDANIVWNEIVPTLRVGTQPGTLRVPLAK